MDLHPKQFVRVNVTTIKSENSERPVNRNFSVDPRTITLDRLQHLVARALDVRGEFSVLWLRESGDSVPLCCDWDLEGALSEEPRLDLRLELHSNEPGLEEWDIICSADVPVAGHEASSPPPRTKRQGSFLEQVLHLCAPLGVPLSARPPLTESEFASLADWPRPLRYAVYRAGGAESSVRPALWMHLLDVYPSGASHKEREEFLNRKAEEYYGLRHSWQKLVRTGTVTAELRDITCLVRKDVRRTDRPLDLDERALYNVLTTYAVHHPSTSYRQGMSDLLSPLLHVMGTEARAYVAFCGLMLRMRDNFRRDGRSVRLKFRHLRQALRAHDPLLHAHLAGVCGGLDLLFCYRWLLLDLKREFPYREMLTLKEIMWATLPPMDREKGVELSEVPLISTTEEDTPVFAEEEPFGGPPTSMLCGQDAVLPMRQDDIGSDRDESSTDDDGRRNLRRSQENDTAFRRGKDSGKVNRQRLRRRRRRPKRAENEERRLDDDSLAEGGHAPLSEGRRRHGSNDSNYGSNLSGEESGEDTASSSVPPSSTCSRRSEGYDSHRSISSCSSEDSLGSFDDSASFDTTRLDDDENDNAHLLLPPPTRFGDGKPFLIFLCLTMILNQRDAILDRDMDAAEMGVHFDRMVRAHRLADVLPTARDLFEEYLRNGWTEDERLNWL